MNSSQICFFGQKYLINSYQFCSQTNIFNKINSIDSTLFLNSSFTPLAHVKTSNSSQISYEYYCVLRNSNCVD